MATNGILGGRLLSSANVVDDNKGSLIPTPIANPVSGCKDCPDLAIIAVCNTIQAIEDGLNTVVQVVTTWCVDVDPDSDLFTGWRCAGEFSEGRDGGLICLCFRWRIDDAVSQSWSPLRNRRPGNPESYRSRL